MSELYVPKAGERVRVVEINDPSPFHPIGSVCVAGKHAMASEVEPGWLWLVDESDRGGTWCHVEPALDDAPPISNIDYFMRLGVAAGNIGPNARAALLLIAERMAAGAKLYGEDFTTARNWRAEAAEELLDGVVYLAIEATKGGAK